MKETDSIKFDRSYLDSDKILGIPLGRLYLGRDPQYVVRIMLYPNGLHIGMSTAAKEFVHFGFEDEKYGLGVMPKTEEDEGEGK